LIDDSATQFLLLASVFVLYDHTESNSA
jgi:hypothetical protein